MIEDTAQGQDQYIDCPDWSTVETNIRLLDGNTRTYLGLYPTEAPNADEFLLMGGGENGIYVCTYYNGDEFFQANPLYKDDESVVMLPVGQVSGKYKKQCIPLDQLLAAAKYYFENETIEGFPGWEEL